MTEALPIKPLQKIAFLGKTFEVGPSIPRKKISILPHNILDESGKDISISCPSNIGILATSSMMTGELEVIAYCNSEN